jgi:hypothetical protein
MRTREADVVGWPKVLVSSSSLLVLDLLLLMLRGSTPGCAVQHQHRGQRQADAQAAQPNSHEGVASS